MEIDSELCNAVRDRLVQATIEKHADAPDAVDAVARLNVVTPFKDELGAEPQEREL